jgi:hypothetical protein
MPKSKHLTPGEQSALLYGPIVRTRTGDVIEEPPHETRRELPPVAPYTAESIFDGDLIRERWRGIWRSIVLKTSPLMQAAFCDVADEIRGRR